MTWRWSCWTLCLGASLLAVSTVRSEPAIPFPIEAAQARRLEAARDYIKREAWADAAAALQALLDAREDTLVPIRGGVPEPGAWAGAWAETDRLLATLPAAGREFYEVAHGPRARALLTEARRTGNVLMLEELTRRYFHTTAGREGTRLLGLHHLDRGRFTLAALAFGRLLDTPAAEAESETLFLAALAFRLAGDASRATRAWQRLALAAPQGIRVGDRLVSLADLDRELERRRAALQRPAPAAAPSALPATLAMHWAKPMAQESLTREWMRAAVQQEEAETRVILPGGVPLLAGGRLIYRSHRGVHAVDPGTGDAAWESPAEWALDRMANELRHHPYLATWINGYLANNGRVLFENSVLGMLSSDGERVYAVEDLPVPPYPHRPSGARRRGEQVLEPIFGPELAEAVHQSRLLAFEAATGKVAWEVGGSGPVDGELAESYFLGPPLALDGRLYAIVEKRQELRLVCLDAVRGTVLWSQGLVRPVSRLLHDVGRRLLAIRLVHHDGILVCPTHDGAVLGVDLARRCLAWAYSYREDQPTTDVEPWGWNRWGRGGPRALPRLALEWHAPATVLAGSRVVLTVPDAPTLYCLDPRTGSLHWKAPRTDDDLYLAGAWPDRLLLVGRQACRALHPADGKQLWALPTGMPAGLGVAAGDLYYLPLKTSVSDKSPALAALDVARGTVGARAAVGRGELPGNLVLSAGGIVSQTALTVTLYQGAADRAGE